MSFLQDKKQVLWGILSIFFIANVLLAEFIGTKIFSLERTLGAEPVAISFLGIEGLALNFTAGVILWPFVFLLTDLINEFYGFKAVRFLSLVSAVVILYAFCMVFIAIHLAPADFWLYSKEKQLNLQQAFEATFGQGLWIIIGSLVAFLIGQLIDALTFVTFKRWTEGKWIWLRATGSTLISQLIDSYIVLYIAFSIGADWDLQRIIAIGTLNYIYKFFAAIALTPAIYLLHFFFEKYFGVSAAPSED